jgi:hypothetical protein
VWNWEIHSASFKIETMELCFGLPIATSIREGISRWCTMGIKVI